MSEVKFPALKGKIVEKYNTLSAFAEASGIDRTGITRKLSGQVPFTIKEVERCLELLDLMPSEIPYYFFEKKV